MNTTIALWTRATKSWLLACLLTGVLMAPPSSKPAGAQGISFSSVSGDGANIFSPTYIVPKGMFLDTLTYHNYDEAADVYASQGAKGTRSILHRNLLTRRSPMELAIASICKWVWATIRSIERRPLPLQGIRPVPTRPVLPIPVLRRRIAFCSRITSIP
jgi:hypothetical protein